MKRLLSVLLCAAMLLSVLPMGVVSANGAVAVVPSAHEHTYDDRCDAYCNGCGEERIAPHYMVPMTGHAVCDVCHASGDGYYNGVHYHISAHDDSITMTGCDTDLTAVTIPAEIDHIGDYAFEGCTNLQTITFLGNPTMGEYAFKDCTALSDETATALMQKFGVRKGMFYNCAGLTNITVPQGVTSIGMKAFAECANIQTVSLPIGLGRVYDYAFTHCANLTDVYYAGSKDGADAIYMDDGNGRLTDAEWHYASCADGHTYDNACDNICNTCSAKRTVPHDYDNACDTTCNDCGATRTVGDHAYSDSCDLTCNECGTAREQAEVTYSIANGVATITGFTTLKNGAVVIPAEIDGVPVTAIANYAFDGCTALKSIELPDSITKIGVYAFRNCSNLTQVTIPAGMTTISAKSFAQCTGLTAVTIPNTVTKVGDYAFYGCSNLKNVTFLGTRAQKDAIEVVGANNAPLTSATWTLLCAGDHVFDNACDTACNNCDYTRKVGAHAYDHALDLICNECNVARTQGDVTYSITDGAAAITGVGTIYTGTVVIPAEINGAPVTSIANYAFDGCTALKAIELPDSITKIGTYAFRNCSNLAAVTIPAGMTTVGGKSFALCTGLKTLYLPVTTTKINDYAFYNCTNLTDVYYGGTKAQADAITVVGTNNTPVTNAEWHYTEVHEHTYDNACDVDCNGCGDEREVGDHTYDNDLDTDCNACGEVREVTVPVPDGLNYSIYNGKVTIHCIEGPIEGDLVIPPTVEGYPVTAIDSYAFYEYYELTSVTLPNTVTTIGEAAFRDCFNLKSINLPESVTDIYDAAFSGCSRLTAIDLPSGLTYIADYLFDNCIQLTDITIPDGVTTIGECAFRDCWKIASVTIPSSVTSIEYRAFYNTNEVASALTDVYYGGKPSQKAEINIGAENGILTAATWHYTCKHEYSSDCDADCNECGEERTPISEHNYTADCDTDCNGCGLNRDPLGDHVYDDDCDEHCNGCGMSNPDAHDYDNDCDTDCNVCGVERTIKHVYDHNCDTQCNVCGDLRVTEHVFENDCDAVCSVCRFVREVQHNTDDWYNRCTVCDTYIGTCGDDIIWFIQDDTLILSGTGEMYHYDFWYDPVPWDGEQVSIKKVWVSEGITSLGTNAFCDFVNLTEVELPTTLKKMWMNAFAACESLTEFTIPAGLEEIDVNALYNCTSMLEYKVAEGNIHFTVEDGVLFNADKTAIWAYPIGCHFDTYIMPDTVERVEAYAFSEAKYLETIDFSENLKHIDDEGFLNCIGLKVITLPDSCKSLAGGVFQGCERLSVINLPDGMTRIGPLCFDQTAYYNNLDNWDGEMVLYWNDYLLHARGYFDDVAGVSGVELSGEYTVKDDTVLIADEAFGLLYELSGVELPPSLRIIGDGAFYGCDALTEIVIPEGVTHIMDGAFRLNEKLASVTLPAGLQYIGDIAFEDSAWLASVANAENPLGIVESTESSDGTVDLYVIGTHYSLAEANIPECVVLIADNAFEAAGSSLTTVTLPESLRIIGNEAFINNYNLQSVTVPATVEFVGDYAFGYSKYYVDDAVGYAYDHIDGLVLSGYTNSAADVYAKKFDVPFNYLDGCDHNYIPSVTTPHTCTTAGVKTYTCEFCGDAYTEAIPAAHTNIVIDQAVEPGCMSEGLTQGSHCEACGSVIMPQATIPSLNHIISAEMGEGPTCGQGGYGMGIYCNTCQKYIQEPEYFPPTGEHLVRSYEEVPATCIQTGYTGGTYCGLCDQHLTDRTVVPTNNNHTNVVLDPGYAPTCTKDGADDGSHCGDCGDVIIPQRVIPTEGHQMENKWTIGQIVTSTRPGYYYHRCSVCGEATDIHELPPFSEIELLQNEQGVTLLWTPYDGDYVYHVYRIEVGTPDSATSGGRTHVFTTKEGACIDIDAKPGVTYQYVIEIQEEYLPGMVGELANFGFAQSGTIHFEGGVTPPPQLTAQPKITYSTTDDTAKVTFGVTGVGLTYQWYIKNAGETKYTKSSVATPVYTVTMSDEVYGRSVYCVITDRNGKTVQTDAVTFRTNVTITTQPKTTYAKDGATAKLTVKAAGDGLKYTWYIKNAGATKYTKSSVTSSTYSVTMSDKVHGRYVYCEVTDKYGNKVKTSTVVLRRQATITTQPKTTYAKDGATAKLTIKAVGDGLKYTWYIKNAGSSKYTKSSVASSTYSVTMSDKVHGRYVYCVVTDKYGKTEKSATVLLRRQATITTQPKTTYTKSGSTAKVTVKAVGDGLKYTWYVKNAGATKYSKSSVTSNTYSVKMSSTTKNRQIYCVVTDKYGKTVQSSTVYLRMAATIVSQSDTTYVKNGATAKATVAAAGDGLKYTWYIKNAGSTKYGKSSVTSSTYSVKMSKTVKNRYVYCVVTDKYGNTARSNTVQLKMK